MRIYGVAGWFRLTLTVGMCALVFSCGEEDVNPTGSPGNDIPRIVYACPTPGAHEIPLLITLQWSYQNAISDSASFNVYLGTTSPLPMVSSEVSDTFCAVGPLNANTTYSWRVTAIEAGGDTIPSESWEFQTDQTYVFPITEHNSWSYERMFYFANASSAGAEPFVQDTVYGSSTVEIKSEITLYDTIQASPFEGEWQEGRSGNSFVDFRVNREDGFYLLGYSCGGWTGPPKIANSEGCSFHFGGRRFSSLKQLHDYYIRDWQVRFAKTVSDTVIEDVPVRILAYPLTVGEQWYYRKKEDGSVWDMARQITGLETVSVPAGTFQCHVIRWFWDINDDQSWDADIEGYDYLCPIGITKREYIFYDIAVTDANADSLGTFDSHDVHELTEFQVHH